MTTSTTQDYLIKSIHFDGFGFAESLLDSSQIYLPSHMVMHLGLTSDDMGAIINCAVGPNPRQHTTCDQVALFPAKLSSTQHLDELVDLADKLNRTVSELKVLQATRLHLMESLLDSEESIDLIITAFAQLSEMANHLTDSTD